MRNCGFIRWVDRNALLFEAVVHESSPSRTTLCIGDISPRRFVHGEWRPSQDEQPRFGSEPCNQNTSAYVRRAGITAAAGTRLSLYYSVSMI